VLSRPSKRAVVVVMTDEAAMEARRLELLRQAEQLRAQSVTDGLD
jgi:hypothetical protein